MSQSKISKKSIVNLNKNDVFYIKKIGNTPGYDGHCLRAYYYWPHKMPDINPDSVDSINSIAIKYKSIRQDSKPVTFLLTYGGTHFGLMYNCGFSEQEAKTIDANYHQLYSVSDQWVEDKLKQASVDGYVTVAFGLRVRTPILAKTVMGNKVTPYEAKAEGRTAGNALGQSYGMLNNRAAIEFRQRLMASPYTLNILPIMQIHDAQYHLVKVDLDVLHWYNNNLIECMEWQELPEIQHDQVKLGGEVSVFYPSWNDETVIPNKATKEQIKEKLS